MSENDEQGFDSRHLQPTFSIQMWCLALATYGLLAFALLKGW